MDKLIEKKKGYRPEMRKGIMVDMEKFLGELDKCYINELEASIESFDTYDEVSNETFNDYKVVCGKLEILERLGYLTEEEKDEMLKTAFDMRLKKLPEENDEEDRP